MLPCVLRLRTSPPCQGGLRRCHVFYGSGPYLPTEVGSDAAICPMASGLASRLRWAPMLPHVLWLRTLPLGQGGSWCYHTSRGFQWTMGLRYIKKGLASLAMQLVTRVFKAQSYVSEASDTWAIMTCKTCGQAAPLMPTIRAERRLQCSIGPVDHTQDTATVQDDSTGRCHAADRVRYGRPIG
jgi:hypothetical protein